MTDPDPGLNLADLLVLAAANLWAILRHPRLAERIWRRLGCAPLFATPRGHGMMVQWRKVFDHDPLFIELTDKLGARGWASRRCPEVKSAEIVWQGDRPEDVPDALLTAGYVLKTNHGSGYNYFPGRQRWDRAKVKRVFSAWLARPFDRQYQWAYLRVRPRLYVERLVGGEAPLWEVNLRCHDGAVSAYWIASEQKTPRERSGFFDAEDRRLPPVDGWTDDRQISRDFAIPQFVHSAKDLAARLSRGIDYVRIDLIYDGETLLFNEATVYPESGFGIERRAHTAPLIERAWLRTIAKCWFLSTPQPWPKSLYVAAFRKWLTLRRHEMHIEESA